jgi:hypothetical protein
MNWFSEEGPLRYRPFSFFSILPISFLIAANQSAGAQAPQRDNRPRTASISGRATIAGKPAVNAVVTVEEIGVSPDSSGAEPPIPFKAKTRTDGEGRYLVGGLAEGRYFVRAMLRAFVAPNNSVNPATGRMVALDQGEAREKIDFALIRGGVITGKVIDDEGAPLIARRLQLYRLDEKEQKQEYSGDLMYEMSVTDDRGVYRIYGLPPGRYAISAGGDPFQSGIGKYALTYHPDTTDEKQAAIIEIKEGSEVADVDIRLGSAIKTYEAAGRVVDRETGKPVPGVYVMCGTKYVADASGPGYSASAMADGQGNFNLYGLPPGPYQAMVTNGIGEGEYTSEAAEFEVTNDNVSGVEVKAFTGASVSGFVVIEGAGAAAGNQFQSINIVPFVTRPRDANSGSGIRSGFSPVRAKADGSFVIKGIQAGRVSFWLFGAPGDLRIKRIERDGVEIKDAIEVKPGERVTGVRIVIYRVMSRLRGQFQIAGGPLPDDWQLVVSASRPASAGEANSEARTPVSYDWGSGQAVVDEKGRFVIERLSPGEYDLSIGLSTPIAGGGRQTRSILNQRVIVRENDDTPVKISIDLNRINQQ